MLKSFKLGRPKTIGFEKVIRSIAKSAPVKNCLQIKTNKQTKTERRLPGRVFIEGMVGTKNNLQH